MRVECEIGLAISLAAIQKASYSLLRSGLMGSAILGLMVSAGRRAKPARVPRPVDLQSLLRGLPEAAIVVDCDGKIIDLNQSAEQLSGCSRSELLGQDVQALTSPAVAEDPERRGESVATRALQGEHVRHERQSLRTNGTGNSKELLVSGSPMYDLRDRLIGALIMLQDVTELADLQRNAASSERHFAVGQMTAGLAHDFNNVLNSISDSIYVLGMQKELSEQDRSMLDVMSNAVRRGSEIVSNIREYLRGNRDMRKRFDPSRVFIEALQLAQPILGTRSGIMLVREFEEVPAVEAVPAELRRVFNNLILNALDAMPEGGTLTLRCRSIGNCIVSSVSDTGVGIPMDKQEMIFSPYYTTKPRGTGLGLAGARSAVKSMGGEIHFESSPGEGTTFFVVLPVAASDTKQQVA